MIPVIQTTSFNVKYVEEHLHHDEWTFDAVTTALEPLAFDHADEAERDRVACLQLGLAADDLPSLLDHLSWVINPEANKGALIIYRPQAVAEVVE